MLLTWVPQMGSSLRWMPGDWPSCRLPVDTSESKSFSSSSFPKISTADTRTEKRVPVFSLRSLMSLKSQEMAQGTMPRLWVVLSLPIMVYVLPGDVWKREGDGNGNIALCLEASYTHYMFKLKLLLSSSCLEWAGSWQRNRHWHWIFSEGYCV